MASTSALATSLVQTGLLLATLVLVRIVLVRHLSADAVPPVLRGRVAASTRVCPWLLAAGLVITAAGLALLAV
jgi:hypothetical protein